MLVTSQEICYRSASANLSVSPSVGLAFIGSLVSQDRRQGHATGLLQLICDRADREGLELRLTVGSEGGPEDASNADLIRFYGKFGFEQLTADNAYYLGRQPSRGGSTSVVAA